MHPGPMIRGLEIEGEVADGPQSAIEDQVRNGLAMRAALLVRALLPERAAHVRRVSNEQTAQDEQNA